MENKICTKCGKLLPISRFSIKRTRKDGSKYRETQCIKCVYTYRISKWRKSDKGKVSTRAAIKRFRTKHPSYFPAMAKKRLDKVRNIVLNHYGAYCACCKESISRFLTIDHMNNDGSKRRKNGERYGTEWYIWIINHNFPKDLAIMCYNCNLGRDKNNGVCPHKEL